MSVNSLSLIKLNSVNPLYLIINRINDYIQESNINKYLAIEKTIPTPESKVSLKKYEELWKKLRDLITSITNNTDNYDEI